MFSDHVKILVDGAFFSLNMQVIFDNIQVMTALEKIISFSVSMDFPGLFQGFSWVFPGLFGVFLRPSPRFLPGFSQVSPWFLLGFFIAFSLLFHCFSITFQLLFQGFWGLFQGFSRASWGLLRVWRDLRFSWGSLQDYKWTTHVCFAC